MPFVGTFGRIGGEELRKWFLDIALWSPPEREGTVERYLG